MARDTMEEDRLPAGIRKEVRGLGHLLDCPARSFHRHDEPVHTRFPDDFRLLEIFGIVAVNRRERDDRLDPLPCNQLS
jgi:hypothetical protein